MEVINAFTLGFVLGLLVMHIAKRKTIININTVPSLGIKQVRDKGVDDGKSRN